MDHKKKFLLIAVASFLAACEFKTVDSSKSEFGALSFSSSSACKVGDSFEQGNGKIIFGYVCDDRGEPIANAKIVGSFGGPVNGWQDVVGATDDNGRFQITATGHGYPYFLIAFKDGYANANDITDDRGIIYIGQTRPRNIQPIVMRKL